MELIGLIVPLAFIVLMVSAIWKVFTKAGQPGWAAIVPIYNMVILCKIAGRPLWWMLLFFIPIVSLVPAVVINLDLAKRFGMSSGFGVGLILLPFVFLPILGFGSAEYHAPEEAAPAEA
jgi:hypothetical protein